MALTQLRTKKCSGCGHLQGPGEGNECEGCGEDDKWRFFCQRHNKMFASPLCDACEDAAEKEEAARRAEEEEHERRRTEAEERERRRHEYEREQQRKLEEAFRREKVFVRVAAIPAFVVLAATLLCMVLALQLFTHGAFVIPYTLPLLFLLFGLAIAAAASVLLISVFFRT